MYDDYSSGRLASSDELFWQGPVWTDQTTFLRGKASGNEFSQQPRVVTEQNSGHQWPASSGQLFCQGPVWMDRTTFGFEWIGPHLGQKLADEGLATTSGELKDPFNYHEGRCD